MCASVEDMIHRAVDQLAAPSSMRRGHLIEEDTEIDRWDVRIEDNCLKLLALHQPVAIDLRRITTCSRSRWNWNGWPTWRSTSPNGPCGLPTGRR